MGWISEFTALCKLLLVGGVRLTAYYERDVDTFFCRATRTWYSHDRTLRLSVSGRDPSEAFRAFLHKMMPEAEKFIGEAPPEEVKP